MTDEARPPDETQHGHMNGPAPHVTLPEVPWGKVAAIAGGVAAVGLTVRGVVGLTRVAFNEVRYRIFDGHLPARRG